MFLEFAISPFNMRKNSKMSSSGNGLDFSGNLVDFNLLFGKPGWLLEKRNKQGGLFGKPGMLFRKTG